MYQHAYWEVSLCSNIFLCWVLVPSRVDIVAARRSGARRVEGCSIICGVCVAAILFAAPNATAGSDGSGAGGLPDSTPKRHWRSYVMWRRASPHNRLTVYDSIAIFVCLVR